MRKGLLAAVVVRAVLEIAAIPLLPVLYRKHVAILILLRPTKEVLLYAGFAMHRHDISLPVLILAAAPLLFLGVWQFFWLGRLYAKDLAKKDLPGIAGRILPRKRIKKMQGALDREGEKVVLLARFAAMPSTLISVAAGTSMDWKRFLLFDTAGGIGSFVLMVGLGWFLEDAYDAAGPWLTALGVVALAAGAIVMGRALTREPARPRAKRGASSKR